MLRHIRSSLDRTWVAPPTGATPRATRRLFSPGKESGKLSTRRHRVTFLGILCLITTGACAGHPYESGPTQTIPEPDASDVAAVLFLVGDAGEATVDGSPLLHRLRRDVERWSGAGGGFGREGPFPGGQRLPGGCAGSPRIRVHRGHAQAQRTTVGRRRSGGAQARDGAVFLPGNHDWGNLKGAEGVARLRNEAGSSLGGPARADLFPWNPSLAHPAPRSWMRAPPSWPCWTPSGGSRRKTL